MAKIKKAYFCKECGFEAPKWLGHCPSCGAWNSFTEEVIARENASPVTALTGNRPRSKPQRVREIEQSEQRRFDLSCTEVNRVLGGGLIRGSMILLGGEPGIGKSTLSLQIALRANGLKTLYVSARNRPSRSRCGRNGSVSATTSATYTARRTWRTSCARSTSRLPTWLSSTRSRRSIPTRSTRRPGSVSQIRECAALLQKYAKQTDTSVVVIGHITKDGVIAGPKILEHIVDVVLQFEGDNNNAYRLLRSIKNRFGATFEIGVFEMRAEGLVEVNNPSEILLSHYDEPLSGIAVGAAVDGARSYLIETQALVSTAAYGTPQRSATGFDSRRLNMLLAVLEKRAGLKMYQKDVFLNFAGGFRISDTGLDLSVVAAVLSSYFDRPVGEDTCFAGEIGLSGEIRPAPRSEQRISEAARLGFGRIVVSGYLRKSLPKPPGGIRIAYVNKIEEMARAVFGA